MKRLIILTTIILLLVNAVIGFIVSAYQLTNVILNSAVLLLSGIMFWVVSSICMKDAYKYSLSILFGIIGVGEFVLGFFAPSEWSNNWFAVLMLVILSIEIILVLLTNLVTKKNRKI